MACNGGPNPTTDSSVIINVAAGSTAQLTWHHTLTSSSGDVIDASHKVPRMAYLKKVGDPLTDSGVGGGWFKFQQNGYSGGT
jgi:cellulase